MGHGVGGGLDLNKVGFCKKGNHIHQHDYNEQPWTLSWGSEVSQKEKNKYHILTHIYEVQKNVTDEPICRAGIETQMSRMDL